MSLIKPSGITGLDGSHPLNGNILSAWEIGQLDKDLVSDTAITTTATQVSDPDIGQCREFQSATDKYSELLSVPPESTVLFIYHPIESASSGSTSETWYFEVRGGDIFAYQESGYSTFDIKLELRSNFSTNVVTEYQPFSQDTALYQAAKATAVTVTQGTPVLYQNGAVVSPKSPAGSTGQAFSANPLQVEVIHDIKAEGGTRLGGVFVFNKILSASEMQSVTNDPWALVTAAGSGPTLSSVPATAFPGQSRIVTGTGFGATQGTGGLTIGGVSQTITSWSDTSIAFTTVQGNNKYEAGKTLEVTTDAATAVSDTIELVADTANGFGYVDMSSPNTSDESSVAFGATPTVVTGDQFEWEDFTPLGNLTVDAQGFVTNVDTEGTFRGRFWDATDSTWGAVETFNATIPESAPAFAPDVGIISKTDTTGTIPFSYIGGDADSFEHSTDGGSTWNTVTSPISRTGLTAETTYSGLIRAVNTGGNGPTASYSFTTNAVGVVDNWPFGKNINPTAIKNWEWGKRHPKTGMRVRVYK